MRDVLNMGNENKFIFEDLRVYQRSLNFSVELIKIAIKFPSMYSRLRDQLIGVAISIPLNLAEGSGRLTPKDKRNFYKNSRASVFELIPILEISRKLDLLSEEESNSLRKEGSEISRIISALMKNNNS